MPSRSKHCSKLTDYLETPNPLYEHQHEVVKAIAVDIQTGNQGGVILAPTGIGKTVIMGAAIRALDVRSLVLVPRKLLGNQTYDEFTGIVGFTDQEVGVYHSDIGKREKTAALHRKVLITTPASYMNLVKRGLISPQDFDYVSIDESHRARGDRTRLAIGELIESATVHAWTATDTFVDGSKIGDILFGRSDYVFELPFQEAVRKGYLSPVKNIIIRTGIDASRIGNPNTELTEAQQRTLAMRKGRDAIAIDHSHDYVDQETGTRFRDQSSVWYCTGIRHAGNVAEKLNEKHGEGYAMVVSGETSPQELHQILEAHKNGKFQAIVNADLLIEGWDNPRVSVAYMLRDTQSPIITMQTGGRAVRIDQQNPAKHAFVVNLVDEGRPHSMVFADVAGGLHIVSQVNDRWERLRDRVDGRKSHGGKSASDFEEPETMEIRNGAVIVTDTQFRHFLKHRQEEREALKVEKKTDEWLGFLELAALLRTTAHHPVYRGLWEQAEQTGEIEGSKVKCGMRINFSTTAFYVHVSEVEFFREKMGRNIEVKTEDWKTRYDTLAELKTTPANGKFAALWQEIEETGSYQGREIACGMKLSIPHKVFCIHSSEIPFLKSELGLDIELKTPEWKAKIEFSRLIGVSSDGRDFIRIWQELETTGKLEGREIRCGLKQAGSLQPFCIHESEAEFIKRRVRGEVEEKLPEWKTKAEFAQLLKTTISNTTFAELWKQVQDTGEIDGAEIRSGLKRNMSRKPFCVHESEAEIFRTRLGFDLEDKTPEWKGRAEIAVLLEIKSHDAGLGRMWTEIQETGFYQGKEIRSGFKKTVPKKAFCIHESEVAYICDEYRNSSPGKPSGQAKRGSLQITEGNERRDDRGRQA